MEKIRRQIKLFWTQNGKLLLQIVGISALVILVIQGLNQFAILQNQDEEKRKSFKATREIWLITKISYYI